MRSAERQAWKRGSVATIPSPLQPCQVEELARHLRSVRAEVVARVDAHTATVRERGEAGGDEADLASREREQATALRIAKREVEVLAEIDAALERVAEGTYGICEGTGDPIGYARLKARPWVRYSLAYKEELERAEKAFGR